MNLIYILLHTELHRLSYFCEMWNRLQVEVSTLAPFAACLQYRLSKVSLSNLKKEKYNTKRKMERVVSTEAGLSK